MAQKRQQAPGSTIVISAPSGSGKSTLVKKLLERVPSLRFSISHTTRARRLDEVDGRDYFFVSPAKFKRMVASRQFVEWADVFGNYYGTSWKQLRAAQAAGKDVLLDIDVQGHRQVRRRLPDAVSVFVLPPSYRELERRLRQRHSDAPESIRHRLAEARKEVLHWREYDYLVVNDELERATQAICAVVHAARYRKKNQQARAREIQRSFAGGKTG